MTTTQKAAPSTSPSPDGLARLREQYGCGPVEFAGSDNALYERHLIFDNVVNPRTLGLREQFEAFARSVRDILSQRWVLTEETYNREDPKRIYYLSMEFLIGRSLANNVTNLLAARPDQGFVPAGVLCHSCRTPDPRQRCFQPDFNGRL
jgi:glycogen phosphorylase